MERTLVGIALFAALIAALGLLPKFDLAGGVPITAQSLGVMLAGLVLGSWRGGLAALLFVLLVALGLPLLSGGRGGLGVFATPSLGYLIGFPLAAFVIGFMMERLKLMPILPASLLSVLIGSIIVLTACGIVGWSFIAEIPLQQAALLAIVFVPGDLVKMVIAAFLVQGLHGARPLAILSRQ